MCPAGRGQQSSFPSSCSIVTHPHAQIAVFNMRRTTWLPTSQVDMNGSVPGAGALRPAWCGALAVRPCTSDKPMHMQATSAQLSNARFKLACAPYTPAQVRCSVNRPRAIESAIAVTSCSWRGPPW